MICDDIANIFRVCVLAVSVYVVNIIYKNECVDTITTCSGTHAPLKKICSGDLIFEEHFNSLDMTKWEHEQTLSGGGNGEFQWYTNNRSNSYVQDGKLHIVPTLLSDHYGEKFLYSGTLDINGGYPAEGCTNPQWNGCKRTGTTTNILNPIKSACLRSLYSFAFKYGKIEIRAKIPAGDWLWPGIWLMPKWNQYSTWPVSGEIDIMESRGNRHLVNTSTGVNIGVQQVGSSLHWGPHPFYNRYPYAHYEKESLKGYNVEFHNYQLEWTSNYIKFSIDDVMTGIAVPPEGGFWELGELNKTGLDNPYKRASKMAPFDQEFYIIFNTAVGGQNGYFPDKKEATNLPRDKPWSNNAGDATTAFWKGREQWLPTWNIGTDDSHLQIDYVKVWAI